ncbi:MAG: hypothetical protein OZSIB_0254 [Candidatus Ozemobacter sibiricus]|uniref:DUF2723 domain-containing protein n=1 Tax=Candidatus Ozemobacter sibiricus TaxID=2268124 RepID=A0A367ZM71_9BACT|nr:MAG: hypothetical protein OZSIB_0254 [Candidatus Ozemobacter sibiricus]
MPPSSAAGPAAGSGPGRSFALWFAVLAIGLAMYLPTLHPSITWYNSGELVAAAMTLDVPHPPGYPLFTRLANLAVRLPLGGEPAWRVNLLSALLGASGAGFFALWLHRAGLPAAGALAMAVWAMGFATFWEQATNAEVYTLEVLLLSLYLWVGWGPTDGRFGPGRAFALGCLTTLGIGNRPTFAVLALALLPRWQEIGLGKRLDGRTLEWAFLGAMVGGLPTLDLYLRLQNPERVLMDPLVGRGLDGFWRVFTAADFRKALFVFPPGELLARAWAWVQFMAGDGGPALIILPGLALWHLARGADSRPASDGQEPTAEQSPVEAARAASPRSWLAARLEPAMLACLWILLVNSGFVLNYNAFEAQTMLLPSVLALCGMSGLGVARLTASHPALGVFILCFVAAGGVLLGHSRLTPRDQEAVRWAARMTAAVPRGATLLVSNDVEFRPLWYLRLAHGFRPDLTFRLIDALGPEEIEVLRQEVRTRPVLGSLVYPPDLRALLRPHFLLEPAGFLTRLRPLVAEIVDAPRPGGSTLRLSDGGTLSVDTPQIKTWPIATAATQGISESRLRAVSYDYTLFPAGDSSFQRVIGAFLVDAEGKPPQSRGVLTAYDLHRALDMLPGPPAHLQPNYGLRLHREFVLPADLPPGTWSLRLLEIPIVSTSPEIFPTGLPDETLLNLEGATEVFRLAHGLGDRPLIRAAPTWEQLVAGWRAPDGAPSWLDLGPLWLD